MTTCKSTHCTYPHSHTTIAHKCGSCSTFGHGQVECGNQTLKNNLLKYYGDRIHFSARCNIENCQNPDTHSATSHHCKKCTMRHDEKNCIIQSLEYHKLEFPNDRYLEAFNSELFIEHYFASNTIVPISLGQGCQLFVRINYGDLSSLFLHSDYGYGGDDPEIYHKYIEGYTMLQPNQYSVMPVVPMPVVPMPAVPMPVVHMPAVHMPADQLIACPICRTETSVITIYGSEEECKICLDNKVERCFVGCGHPCVCGDCLDMLIATPNTY